MKQRLVLEVSMVLTTVIIFLFMLVLNEWIFTHTEFVRGINWVYLPAGIRLLCTLLFGAAGAVGLLIASWLASFYYFFPDDAIRAAAGTVISTVAPYLVYRYARRVYGLRASLANLGPGTLLLCAAAYAFANASLHHLWFWMHGDAVDWSSSLFLMLIGDLNGTLLILYGMKLGFHLFSLAARAQPPSVRS